MKIRGLFFLTIIAAILGMVIACGDTQASDGYTVRFEANGGYPAPQNQTVSSGGKVAEPAPITKTGYGFGGWYKEASFINLWNFTTDVVTGNITLYAKWDINYYIVKFEANGGSPAPQNQAISYSGKVIKPQDMSKEGYIFQGWYKEAAFINLWDFNSDTVTRDITLYAKWGQPVIVQGTTLTEKLQWLESNAVNYGTYILEVNSAEDLIPHTLSYNGKSNISILLIGIDGVKTIRLYGFDSLFTVENGVTLVLENIVLDSYDNYVDYCVKVNSGNLILHNGSKISDSGVYISDGTFTMNGGEISGGRVYIDSGTFTMNGGEIFGSPLSLNTPYSYSRVGYYYYYYYNYCGMVYIYNGTFTMTGGKISGNTTVHSRIEGDYTYLYGGGVSVNGGTFTMTGGEISGNTVSSSLSSSSPYYYYGGGVCITNGTFTMTGGEISGNTAYCSNYSNNSSSGGGGVYISNGTFTMTGGEISGNTASSSSSSSYGGGVYVDIDSRFEKTGGIITGYSSDTANGNVVKNSNENVSDNGGHAVYAGHNNNSFVRRKETTAEQGDNLIYIRNEPNPPTISGAWDE